jgi:hypothetical protein
MRNYEFQKFVDLYVRKTNDKGKAVKIKFAKTDASTAELSEIKALIGEDYYNAWEIFCKRLAKEFKAQEEIENYKEFVMASKKPNKKLTLEYALPTETIVL